MVEENEKLRGWGKMRKREWKMELGSWNEQTTEIRRRGGRT